MEKVPDCMAIEKCIKDMIFNKSEVAIEKKSKLIPPANIYQTDDRCFVSNIEKLPQAHRNSFSQIDPRLKLHDQPSSSELIDVNVLTTFAAKHYDENLTLDGACRQLPHPDHEDDFAQNGESQADISLLIDSMSKEIKNSPNFINMPENPLQSNVGYRKNYRNDDLDYQEIKRADRKIKSKKKKAEKQKRTSERMMGLYLPREEDQISSPIDNSIPPSEKKNESAPTTNSLRPGNKLLEDSDVLCIKAKENSFSLIGKEYSLILENDHNWDDLQYRLTCHLCDFNTDRPLIMNNHLISKNHLSSKQQNDQDMMLPFLPDPLAPQIEAINELLIKLNKSVGLGTKDSEEILNFFQKLKGIIEDKIPPSSIDIVGSSITGIGFKDSEVDFILKVKEEKTADCLEELSEFLKKDQAYEKVVADFKKKRPSIRFRDKVTGLFCNVLIDSSCYKVTHLLSTYFKLDHRARILGTVVHRWAQICQINKQDQGTLPSFSYSIFVIHFLQQVQPPVLPVLHEVNTYTTSNATFYEEYISNKTWKSQNSDSVAELWLKFFRFYNYDYELGKDVICIRSSKRTFVKDRAWNTKFYAVEDPFSHRNLAHVIPSYQICGYIRQCFLQTYRYFAYPQLKIGSIRLLKSESFDPLKLTECVLSNTLYKEAETEDMDDSDGEDQYHDELEDHDPDVDISSFIATVSSLNLNDKDPVKKTNELTDVLSSSPTKANSIDSATKIKHPIKASQPPLCYWDIANKTLTKDLFNYQFQAQLFKAEKGFQIFCKNCKTSGHMKKDCPADDLPLLNALPMMTARHLEMIFNALHYIKDSNCVGVQEMTSIENDKNDILKYIKEVYPDAKLTLFGSFCNGFGFKERSDMDFCMTFGDRNDAKDLDSKKIIENVGRELSRHPELTNVLAITTAKVPIVKFTWTKNGLEGDISLYNRLALINTEMLLAYSKIDPRVQILGYALKYFAKILGICDASRGSLSSYAYILMVLFYLQQRNPPVIPVLQELYSGEKPSELVDGCNVWYYGDLDRLKDVWPEYGRNKETVAELWVGLFRFYMEEFDWKEYVVSIKQKKPLSRFRKLWMTDELAIEDPFDLTHNLGAGLSKKMNCYILKTFIRGRERFGTPTDGKCDLAFLFDREFLNSGCEPPHDRGCSNCGKIGHIARNCPQDKTCSYCRRTGHLIKTCPNRNQRTGTRRKTYNSMSPEKEKHASLGANKRFDHPSRTYANMQSHHPMDRNENQKFFNMGIPGHRFPTPGFNHPRSSYLPGYTQNQIKPGHPPVGFAKPFSAPPRNAPPFPQNPDMYSKSPPKPYAASPPKNFPGFSGLQVERHPIQPGNNWPMRQRRPMLPNGPNQSHNLDHRIRKINPEAHNSYNIGPSNTWW